MINPAIEEDLKNMSLNDVNYADYIKENYVPIEVLQEIRQEIEKIPTTIKGIGYFNERDVLAYQIDVLKIIDSHISALNNDQFERIWQNTVEEMRRRKICEDILEEAEEYDSETMNGSLLTDDDLRQLIGDGINKCKEEHTYTSETGCTDKKCPFYLNPDYTRCKDCEEKRKAGIIAMPG